MNDVGRVSRLEKSGFNPKRCMPVCVSAGKVRLAAGKLWVVVTVRQR